MVFKKFGFERMRERIMSPKKHGIYRVFILRVQKNIVKMVVPTCCSSIVGLRIFTSLSKYRSQWGTHLRLKRTHKDKQDTHTKRPHMQAQLIGYKQDIHEGGSNRIQDRKWD